MSGYAFDFLPPVEPLAVAEAVTAVFGLAGDRIEVVAHGTVVRRAVGMPVVYIEYDPESLGERVSFSAGEVFAEWIGNPAEVAVASRLCARLRARAMLGVPNTASGELWRLVAADGSSGLVLIDTADENEGRYVITAALEPISGAPEVPVVEPPGDFNPYYT